MKGIIRERERERDPETGMLIWSKKCVCFLRKKVGGKDWSSLTAEKVSPPET